MVGFVQGIIPASKHSARRLNTILMAAHVSPVPPRAEEELWGSLSNNIRSTSAGTGCFWGSLHKEQGDLWILNLNFPSPYHHLSLQGVTTGQWF